MKNFKRICFLLIAMHHVTATADVFINMEQTDEISISNTQVNQPFTLKIVEPVITKAITLATTNHKTNSFKQSNSAQTALLPYHDEVLQAANLTSLEPALIHAVIAVESKHNARATSQKGAYGLMQLMPATARRFHVKDKTNAAQNILAGSQYLRELLTLFNGDLKLSLAAYNAGPGAVQKYSNRVPPYRETMHYVPKVLQYYRQYS
ncbi:MULTISPECIES: lytic transglycosylase domain-containing protein [Methylotenera]|uniref:lytic transglycosylase domain-containing protein n=1 Tax=Methylotenera TaxID=359407 RepID=UPI00039FE26C|nr:MULTISPECIES: lytic transglycosylase domain-containing protein [Methylotenera]